MDVAVAGAGRGEGGDREGKERRESLRERNGRLFARRRGNRFCSVSPGEDIRPCTRIIQKITISQRERERERERAPGSRTPQFRGARWRAAAPTGEKRTRGKLIRRAMVNFGYIRSHGRTVSNRGNICRKFVLGRSRELAESCPDEASLEITGTTFPPRLFRAQ